MSTRFRLSTCVLLLIAIALDIKTTIVNGNAHAMGLAVAGMVGAGVGAVFLILMILDWLRG